MCLAKITVLWPFGKTEQLFKMTTVFSQMTTLNKNVLGSPSIWMCQIMNFHYLFCFLFTVPACIRQQQIFNLQNWTHQEHKDYSFLLFDLLSFAKNVREHGFFICQTKYRKVLSSNVSHLEAHADFFRFLNKGIFHVCTVTFWQKKWFPN